MAPPEASFVTLGLILTSLGLGVRHGIDWDHIAAIADLSSTAESRKRGFALSCLYAVGHGAVVMALGAVAILFGAALPDGVDVWMGRVVGATLVILGGWVLIELVRKGRGFRLRSRWILVISGTFAGLRRVTGAGARRRLTIRHEHEHQHEYGHGDQHGEVVGGDALYRSDDEVADPQVHDHDHLRQNQPVEVPADSPEPVGSTTRSSGGLFGRGHGHRHGSGGSLTHSHAHRHDTTLADSAAGTGNGAAAGIGLLHGIGFESPTQIAVFVASTSVVGAWAGFALLAAWVAGLLIANSMLAGLAAYGLLGAERNFAIYATVAVFVGVASLVMGALLLAGLDVLPSL